MMDTIEEAVIDLISAWIVCKVEKKNRLDEVEKHNIKEEENIREQLELTEFIEDLENVWDKTRNFDIKKRENYAFLSDDAKEIINLVLNPTKQEQEDICSHDLGRVTQPRIERHLFKKGWHTVRVNRAMTEVRSYVALF